MRFLFVFCIVPAAAVLVSIWPAAAAEPDLVFEENVMVPMRDGVRLAANVFRPRRDGQFPAVLMRSPYGKPGGDWGEAARYVGAEFAMVVQDCRGKGDSEGVWDPFRYDAEDGFDTQEWLGDQPWSNGEIGTAGGSYVGWTQWASAPLGSPHLKAMMPVVPFADVYDDIAYSGGAFQLALLMGWGAAVGGVALDPDGLQEAYAHLPLRTYGDQFERKVFYLNDWARHPFYDDYWKVRGIDRQYDDVAVPVLNVGGWYDIFSKPTIEMVDRVRESSKDRMARRNQIVVMGPWAHGVGVRRVGELDFGEEAAMDMGDLQFRWMRYWLQDEETGVHDWPAYHLFVMGENRWRGEDEWPLERTRFTPYYLRSAGKANTLDGDGQLALEEPGEEPQDSFVYDPSDPAPTQGGNNLIGAPVGPMDQREVEKRSDVLVYTTEALAEDVEVTGPVTLVLYAASTARDTDFTGKLVDVHPDGAAYNLCDGILRARYREGRDRVELLEPGKVYRFEIDLWVTSNRFRRGHRIRLEVSSSNYPRFDRNPNTGGAFGEDEEFLPATQTVFHDGEHPSHLLLPVIPR